MTEARTFRVFDEHGYIGELMAPSRPMDPGARKSIRLEDGRQIDVNPSDLRARPDGSFQLRSGWAGSPQGAKAPQPVAAPEPVASAPAEAAALNGDFYEQAYDIERVAVGRVLDGPVEQRQEGDTLILPVLEEVLVCEKKLVLKEEIRITMRRQPVQEVRRVGVDSIRNARSA